jgi:hypothetical protein
MFSRCLKIEEFIGVCKGRWAGKEGKRAKKCIKGKHKKPAQKSMIKRMMRMTMTITMILIIE